MSGIEHWLAAVRKDQRGRLMLGRVGLALPYAIRSAIGIIFLFATKAQQTSKRRDGALSHGKWWHSRCCSTRDRAFGTCRSCPGRSVGAVGYADPSTIFGAHFIALHRRLRLRVAIKGNAAFALSAEPLASVETRGVWRGQLDEQVQEAQRLFPHAAASSSASDIASIATAYRQ
jgi:type IV secretion system protein VirD4